MYGETEEISEKNLGGRRTARRSKKDTRLPRTCTQDKEYLTGGLKDNKGCGPGVDTGPFKTLPQCHVPV